MNTAAEDIKSRMDAKNITVVHRTKNARCERMHIAGDNVKEIGTFRIRIKCQMVEIVMAVMKEGGQVGW